MTTCRPILIKLIIFSFQNNLFTSASIIYTGSYILHTGIHHFFKINTVLFINIHGHQFFQGYINLLTMALQIQIVIIFFSSMPTEFHCSS